MTIRYFIIAFTENCRNGYCPIEGEPVNRSRRLCIATYTSDDSAIRQVSDASARRWAPTFVEMVDRECRGDCFGKLRLEEAVRAQPPGYEMLEIGLHEPALELPYLPEEEAPEYPEVQC